jgi:hypothetical protein
MKNFFVLVYTTALLSANIPIAKAERACSNDSIAGKYGTQASGQIVRENVPPVLFAETGVINFDGQENLNGNDTVSFNGNITKSNYSGTYSVKEDCTFSAKFTDNLGNTVNWTGTVVNSGKEILVLEAVPSTVITAVFKRI